MGSPRGPQLTGTPFHRQLGPLPTSGASWQIETQIVRDEQIETPVPVVVDEGAARSPPGLPGRQPGGARHVLERAVAAIMVQHVLAVVRDRQIDEAVVVVVARHRRRMRPSHRVQPGMGGDVRERAVVIVVVEVRAWRVCRRIRLGLARVLRAAVHRSGPGHRASRRCRSR